MSNNREVSQEEKVERWKEEYEKCKADPAYFIDNYMSASVENADDSLDVDEYLDLYDKRKEQLRRTLLGYSFSDVCIITTNLIRAYLKEESDDDRLWFVKDNYNRIAVHLLVRDKKPYSWRFVIHLDPKDGLEEMKKKANQQIYNRKWARVKGYFSYYDEKDDVFIQGDGSVAEYPEVQFNE